MTTAGTEVSLTAASQLVSGPVAIKALSTNTGTMYIGNAGDGTVSSSSGYPLAAGEQIILNLVGDMTEIMVDASVNGEKVAWLIL